MVDVTEDKLETMVVIGDDYVVLKFVFETLKNAKCVFLQPGGDGGAFELAAEYAGGCDLLRSDVRRPKTSGADLADVLKTFRPDIRIKFMPGFPGEELVVINYGCQPLKPGHHSNLSSLNLPN